MLQELLLALTDAEELLVQMGLRFHDGDATAELADQFAVRFDEIAKRLHELGTHRTSEVDVRLAELVVRLQSCVAIGEGWLNQTANPAPAARTALRAYQAHGNHPVELGPRAPATTG